MRRLRYWLFMALAVPAVGIALLFVWLAWALSWPGRRWRRGHEEK